MTFFSVKDVGQMTRMKSLLAETYLQNSVLANAISNNAATNPES